MSTAWTMISSLQLPVTKYCASRDSFELKNANVLGECLLAL